MIIPAWNWRHSSYRKAIDALKCLFNVRDKAHAFKVLDSKYGDILMVFPRIKADLEALKDLPTSMLEESAHNKEIINVTVNVSMRWRVLQPTYHAKSKL